MKKIIFVLILFLAGCNGLPGDSGQDTGDSRECVVDEDCVPAQCCHATSCVPKDEAPNCGGVFCTAECRPGTIDCGGGCYCSSGKCAARLMETFE